MTKKQQEAYEAAVNDYWCKRAGGFVIHKVGRLVIYSPHDPRYDTKLRGKVFAQFVADGDGYKQIGGVE